MPKVHTEFLVKNGRKEFAVMTYEDYRQMKELIEDYEDLVDLRKIKKIEKNRPTNSLKEIKRRLKIA